MAEDFESDLDFALGAEAFPSRKDYDLHCLRHSTSHVMAAAVQTLFPEVKFGIGPPIQNGFYYDMLLARPLTPEDLEAIEARMREIVKGDREFIQETWPKDKALDFFGSRAQELKIELINGIAGDTVSTYRIGDFTDLCAGPHVKRTSECRHFKLTSIAGAYWRGSEKNPMLQRIYGTVWPTAAELEDYLNRVEEAKRRDHRKLGRELELLMSHEWAPGVPFWLPKGTLLYHTLQEKMRRLLVKNGYHEVKAPLMGSEMIFKTSGHWKHYKDDMFVFKEDDSESALKPMNCPMHMLIFGSTRRSYRELPLRFAEQSVLHRNERAGALAGLTRVRQFQQDDAHIFLTEDQVVDEVTRLLNLLARVYGAFGMSYRYILSVRGGDKKYMGESSLWDRAEQLLADSLKANGIEYTVAKGEAGFYGPKIDQLVQDSLQREHQLGTIQLDFQLPRAFGLRYVTEQNTDAVPAVIHRALHGSFERFIGILIEHYAGAFPVWLAPEQARVLSISEKAADYARSVQARFLEKDLRVGLDVGNEKIGAKIRDAELQKVPYMLVVGGKEAEAGAVAVRAHGKGDEGAVPLDAFLARLAQEATFDY